MVIYIVQLFSHTQPDWLTKSLTRGVMGKVDNNFVGSQMIPHKSTLLKTGCSSHECKKIAVVFPLMKLIIMSHFWDECVNSSWAVADAHWWFEEWWTAGALFFVSNQRCSVDEEKLLGRKVIWSLTDVATMKSCYVMTLQKFLLLKKNQLHEGKQFFIKATIMIISRKKHFCVNKNGVPQGSILAPFFFTL